MYRNIDDAFPLAVGGLVATVAGSAEALMGQPVALDAGYERKVDGFIYALGELNESVMMSFRAVYATYQSDPCIQSAFLARKVDELTAELQRLTGLRLELRAFVELAASHPDQTQQIWQAYSKLVDGLRPGRDGAELASREIDTARDVAHRWIDGAEEDG